jgi:hypothetical protein
VSTPLIVMLEFPPFPAVPDLTPPCGSTEVPPLPTVTVYVPELALTFVSKTNPPAPPPAAFPAPPPATTRISQVKLPP